MNTNRKLRNILGVVLTSGVFALGGTAGVQPALAADAAYAGVACDAGAAHKIDGIPGSIGNTSTTKTLLVACPHATDPSVPSVSSGGYVEYNKHNTSVLSCAMRFSDFLGTNVVSSPTQSTTGSGTSFFFFSALNGFFDGHVYFTCTLPKATSATAYTRINGYNVYD